METKDRRWRLPSRLCIPLFILIALAFILDLIELPHNIPRILPTENIILEQDTLKGYLIKTSGCRIPDMDPFDKVVMEFIHKPKKPKCNDGIPALFDSNLTSIFLVNSSLDSYTDQDVSALNCCYQPFYRAEPDEDDSDKKIRFSRRCIPFKISANIKDEFIRVICHLNRTILYRDFFSFVPIKTEKKVFEKKPLNILLIGLDSVSRLNLYRQMPKTLEYLKNLSAVELLGYNKVADNTFPNLMPILTGFSETYLSKICLNEDNNHRFDTCPFIWNDFKAKGFVTSFGEDCSWMGLFNYMRKGFKKQPTDYMWGVFNRIAESRIGNSHNLNVDECVGARQVYRVFLNYIQNFVLIMETQNLPYFSLFWGSNLSHDDLNKPSLGDKDYYKFFKKLNEKNFLNNTVMIFLSDHGIRWGDIRQTYQGQLEERLPFVFLLLPDWFKRQYSEAYNNLVKNTKRLTSPYDLHETLRDLIDPTVLSDDNLYNRNHQNTTRGYSLFSEIPPNRTCESADIASHWCACQQSVEIDINDTLVVRAAFYAVDYMNQQLQGYAQCANLTVSNITNARLMTPSKDISSEDNVKDYMLILETAPGNGVFEVTLRHTDDSDDAYQFEVIGTISRLNLYGKQSSCITDFHLKLYCYCKSLLDFQ